MRYTLILQMNCFQFMFFSTNIPSFHSGSRESLVTTIAGARKIARKLLLVFCGLKSRMAKNQRRTCAWFCIFLASICVLKIDKLPHHAINTNV